MIELGCIKGAAFGGFASWYQTHGDSERLRAVTLALQEQHPDLFDADHPSLGILPSHWYPAELVHDFLDRLLEGEPPSSLSRIAEQAADEIMKTTIRGVYKSVFAVLVTPDRYMKHVDKLWSLHYDSGRPVVEKVGPKEHRVTYVGWRGHHPMICRLNAASGKPIYTAMGCKDVVVRRIGCVSEGASRCQNTISWR